MQTYAYEVVGKSENLKEGAEMKFSIPFSAAIVLIYGDLLPNRFNDENLNNSKIRSLVRKIIVYPSKEMDTTFPKHKIKHCHCKTSIRRSIKHES